MFTTQPVPPVFQDVLARRWLSLSGEVRHAALGTKGVLSSFWYDKDAAILAVGDSSYQGACKSYHKRFGTPIPGLVFASKNSPPIGVISLGARMCKLQTATFGADSPAVISVTPGGSVLIADAIILLREHVRSVKVHVQVAFGFYTTGDFTSESAAGDLETLLIRQVDEHIKRVAFSHGSD